MKKVIIGAGPAGLYTAIKLRQAGVLDVVVYDPRAGRYTRPGHLGRGTFPTAEMGLRIELWKDDRIAHIKDLERALYKEAQRLGIKIENKRFVELHQDAKKPGVVILSDSGEREIVEADYVFDCTGTQRRVVAAVNKVVPDSPLQLTTITELPVPNHFIAYIKMSQSDWEKLDEAIQLNKVIPDAIDAVSYAQSITKLRALGWKEFKFPRCTGMPFGKDKVCLYLHAPEHLEKADYDTWVQTVLECYTKPIRYTHLPPSPKPRFLPFLTTAQALQDVSFKGKNLPTVIPLGDAQIDFDYYLGHGIRDGMVRIDALFSHMEVFDNAIYYFDSAEYLQTIEKLLRQHKEEVIKEAHALRESFATALGTAQLKFRTALLLSTKAEEQAIFSEILKEIDAQQSHIQARQVFAECHNSSNHVVFTFTHIEPVFVKLNQIQTDLLKTKTGLPVSFEAQHKEVEELLVCLAGSWKEIGNAFFKGQNLPRAIEAYKKALEIYNIDVFFGKHSSKELPIYSNLAVAYLKERLYSEAIVAAQTALSIFDRCDISDRAGQALQEKIIFNLIKALCAQAQAFIESSKHQEARDLHSRATSLISRHRSRLTETLCSIESIIGDVQKRLPSGLDSRDDEKDTGAVGEKKPLSRVAPSLQVIGVFGGQSGGRTPSLPVGSYQGLPSPIGG